jgi:IS5 family transposase
MRPKKEQEQPQRELFQVELEQLVDTRHPLVQLGMRIDWASFELAMGATYHPTQGAPGISTRLMVALHYLKYQHDLSDENVVAHWVENPYWQHFSGQQFFQHRAPIDASSMTRWRGRLGEAGAELMLRSTIETGMAMGAIRPAQLKRINVDTTVQTKAIRFPTDARLYNRCRERLVKTARQQGIKIKQSYQHTGKKLLLDVSRYAHARQMKRARAATRKLRTNLGRVMREIERQAANQVTKPMDKLVELLKTAHRIHAQQKNDKNKIYSVHEPETQCIAKGKAGKKYEFGNKVSVAVTSRGGWLVGAQSYTGNPYDGHTLASQLEQVSNLIGAKVSEAYVDMGYRGHNYEGEVTVRVDKRRRGRTPRPLWRWMKRRAAVEPSIGHLKAEHRLERNRLKGVAGDAFNAILSAAAMNFQKLLRAFWRIFLRCLLRGWGWIPGVQERRALRTQSASV